MLTRWPWEEEDQGQHTNDGPQFYFPPSDYQPMTDSSPFSNTSVIASTPMASLYADDYYAHNYATPSHGLPAPSQLSPVTVDNHMFRLRAALPPTSQYTTTAAPVDNSPHAQALTKKPLNKKQLQRLRELRDEVYPLKLIRALDRISEDEASLDSNRKSVFEVVHIKNAAVINPSVERVGIYSTVQAANDRALDFWAQTYGAPMFTDGNSNRKPSRASTKDSQHIEKSAGQACHYSSQKKRANSSAGGIPMNGSRWVITNKCLSLRYIRDKREHRVYVAILQLRDQGIHD
ncbi:hypothetical protein F5Y07DRAFT_223458 [Xylaria sp. FL0933]|nr:hypothetical protein F5Y07DRAFT_223458 [Xylaria sp. FL0933]